MLLALQLSRLSWIRALAVGVDCQEVKIIQSALLEDGSAQPPRGLVEIAVMKTLFWVFFFCILTVGIGTANIKRKHRRKH